MFEPFSSTSPAAGSSNDQAAIERPRPFAGHRRWINAICYSPDGKQVATGGDEPPIRIWDSDTGEMMFEPKGHDKDVESLSYSPDGKRLVSGDVGGGVCIWDTSDGELVLERKGCSSRVNTIAYSPDNQHIASGDDDHYARIWRAEDLTQTIEISHPNYVQSVNFSPDGSRLATGCTDHKIRIFDVTTSALVVGPLEGHTSSVTAVIYSPNGEQLASCSSDRTIRIWDASTGAALLGPLEGHFNFVACVVYSPDGKQLVSGSVDKTIRLWDAHTGDLIGGPVRGHDGGVTAISFAPGGTQLITGADDGSMRVWDAQTLEILSPELTADEKDCYRLTGPFRGHFNNITAVAYFPDGERIASASYDSTVRIWNVRTGEEVLGPLRHSEAVISLAISADGARLVSGGEDGIRVWDTRTGKVVLGPIKGDIEMPWRVKFSPDDDLIAAADLHGEIVLWDSRTGTQLRSIRGSSSICFSPDGSRLAAGDSGKLVHVWDVSTAEIVAGPFRGHTGFVNSVAFSPDGLRIVSGSDDKTVRIWDAKTGAIILGPLEAHSSIVWSVSYSPDGTKICSTSLDKTICLWDASTGDLLLDPLRGHRGPVLSAAFSPDGKRIVTGSVDCTIRFWDVATGEIIQFPDTLSEHDGQSGSSFLDLPATGQALQTQHTQGIALGSVLDLPVTTRPQDFSAARGPAQGDSSATTRWFSFSRFRNGIIHIFHTPRSIPDALELEERGHRPQFGPARTAYARTKSFIVIARRWRKRKPRQQPLRDVSDHGSASDEGGRTRDSANVASGQRPGDNDASVSMGQHAETAASNAAQHASPQDQHGPPSTQPLAPDAAAQHSHLAAPQITFVEGSIDSEDSNAADCCMCFPCC